MAYINGFLLAAPNANKEKYKEVAKAAAQVFKDHGALQVIEGWGDDVPDGKVTSFPMAVKLKEGESVVFSWITWPDKETQKTGMEKSMADPRMNVDPSNMPFDGQRMMWGGFDVLVEA